MVETPPPSSSATPTSPYSPLHPLLLPTSNPHLLVKPKSLTLTLASSPSSSSLASMSSSPPPPPPPPTTSDTWEFVAASSTAAAGDGVLDDRAIFPPCLHEGLEVEEMEKEVVEEEEEGWRGRVAAAARRVWDAGVEAVQERVFVQGACGCAGLRPAVWSAAATAVVVGALLYARRRDRKERDLLILLSQEKDKRIAQLLHQIAFLNDIRSGCRAVSAIKNS